MKPTEVYRDEGVLRLIQIGVEQGYAAGAKPRRVKVLGGLITAKAIELKPSTTESYYDIWWFPGRYGIGSDAADTGNCGIRRVMLGGVTSHTMSNEKEVLGWHRKVLRQAGTQTRLDQSYRQVEGPWTYNYGLLFPLLGHTGIGLALEQVSYNGKLAFWHLFGLFPTTYGS